MIYGGGCDPQLEGNIDVISISLNAENAEKYSEICHPEYGEDAFFSILEFTENVSHIPRVIVTVVDIPGIDIAKCKRLAEELGVEFRLRSLDKR